MDVPKSVEYFELTDDATDIPDWVKDCLDHPEQMATVIMPLMADELVKGRYFQVQDRIPQCGQEPRRFSILL